MSRKFPLSKIVKYVNGIKKIFPKILEHLTHEICPHEYTLLHLCSLVLYHSALHNNNKIFWIVGSERYEGDCDNCILQFYSYCKSILQIWFCKTFIALLHLLYICSSLQSLKAETFSQPEDILCTETFCNNHTTTTTTPTTRA